MLNSVQCRTHTLQLSAYEWMTKDYGALHAASLIQQSLREVAVAVADTVRQKGTTWVTQAHKVMRFAPNAGTHIHT